MFIILIITGINRESRRDEKKAVGQNSPTGRNKYVPESLTT